MVVTISNPMGVLTAAGIGAVIVGIWCLVVWIRTKRQIKKLHNEDYIQLEFRLMAKLEDKPSQGSRKEVKK